MKLNKVNTVKFNGEEVDRTMYNGERVWDAWESAVGEPPLTLLNSLGKNMKALYVTGGEGGTGDLNEETGLYEIPVTVRGKNILHTDPTRHYCTYVEYAKATETGIIAKGASNPSEKAGSYLNGYCDAGFSGTYIEAGSIATVSADVRVLELSENYENNCLITFALYGAVNLSTKSNSLNADGSVKRISASYTVTTSGLYYPRMYLRSNTLEISNVQIAINDTDTAYEPYVKKQKVTVSLPAPIQEGETQKLPETIPTVKGTTVIEVKTAVTPKMLEGKYKRVES